MALALGRKLAAAAFPKMTGMKPKPYPFPRIPRPTPPFPRPTPPHQYPTQHPPPFGSLKYYYYAFGPMPQQLKPASNGGVAKLNLGVAKLNLAVAVSGLLLAIFVSGHQMSSGMKNDKKWEHQIELLEKQNQLLKKEKIKEEPEKGGDVIQIAAVVATAAVVGALLALAIASIFRNN